jgi:hypothetical protein
MHRRPNATVIVKVSTLRPGMKAIVQRTHSGIENVGIDLGRRQIGVAKHHLNRSQIGAALEQMRRKRVSQHVRADLGRESHAFSIGFEDLPEPNARDPRTAPARVDEETR